jgi:DNA mismatch endonuclease (patch repair protein)
MPASHVHYWRQKFERNRARDAKYRRQLSRMGWRVLTIWECQTRLPARLESRLKKFLDRPL